MNLLRAEWSRLFHRRLTLILAAAMLAVLALLVVGFGATSRQPTPLELTTAQGRAAESRQVWTEQRADCLERQRTRGRSFEGECEFGPQPQVDDYLPYRFSFARQIESLLYFSALVLSLVGFILGASFIGAEWTSGGMTNLLLWRPRREAVLGAKLAVVVAGVAAISVAYLALWVGAFWLLGAAIGSVGATSAGAAASIALFGLRILGLTLFLAVAGAALATLGRRTAAALGIAMAYFVVFELGTLIVSSLLRTGSSGQMRLSTYIAALLTKQLRQVGQFQNYVVTWPEAIVVLAVLAAALTGAAFAVVRTRDVT
ncbi:MAG TPA: ABC transporter permease subunit [Micromonosporaceae bacterium]|nr:ABC transporter permease subunit [Micromonosporaceae bacterium]